MNPGDENAFKRSSWVWKNSRLDKSSCGCTYTLCFSISVYRGCRLYRYYYLRPASGVFFGRYFIFYSRDTRLGLIVLKTEIRTEACNDFVVVIFVVRRHCAFISFAAATARRTCRGGTRNVSITFSSFLFTLRYFFFF